MKKYFVLIVLLFSTISFTQSDDKKDLSSYLGAGTISVTLGGDFIVTGTYPALITERVDQFVTRMYTKTREQILGQLSQHPELMAMAQKEIENYSIRNVTLKRTSGEELTLDLMKFRRTGDFADNPYLKNDDVLIFPPSDLERNFFSISGAINKPGKYHYRDGDRLSDAILLAQGLNKAYQNVTAAEINRLSYDGEKMEVLKVNLNDNISLERGDRIVIVADETQKKEFSVRVVGEVKSPGIIPITKNTTTLKEAIERAGGLTEFASLKKSRVFRGNTIPAVLENLYGIDLTVNTLDFSRADTSQFFLGLQEAIMYRMSNVTYEDRDYFKLETQLKAFLEHSSVNFEELNNPDSEAANYAVKDGDLIYVPQKPTTVYVFGQVREPGHINFKEGMDFNYYVQNAGGIGEYAKDEDEIMVIKGGTNEWISPYERPVTMQAGDFVYVPRENVFPFNYYVGQVGNYLSIVASAATVILLLIEFSK